jgi:hypothetical protein
MTWVNADKYKLATKAQQTTRKILIQVGHENTRNDTKNTNTELATDEHGLTQINTNYKRPKAPP